MNPWVFWWVAIALVFSARWTVKERWFQFLVYDGKLVEQTVDCADHPVTAKFEASKDNAERLFRDGHVQVLLSKGDGCFKLNSQVQFYSIQRTKKARQIYQRRKWASVSVSIIIESDYDSLEESRKNYVQGKFKKEAKDLTYSLVTLRVEPEHRPIPPVKVETQHPAAINMPFAEMDKFVQQNSATVIRLADQNKISDDKKRIAIQRLLVPHHLVDPQEGIESSVLIDLSTTPSDKPIVVVGDSDYDGRAYNLVSALMSIGRKEIYWVATGLKNSLVLPDDVPGLETIDCWKALDLLTNGAVGFVKARPNKGPVIWFGQNETDVNYLKLIQPYIKSSGKKSGDYWFKGGSEQLEWCQKHAPQEPETASEDI